MAPQMMLSRSRKALSIRASAAKKVLITGGNTGIGFETAKALLSKGYEVDIAARNENRAIAAQKSLQELVPGAKIGTLPLELADLSSVRDLAKRIQDEGKGYDVVLNNAGVMACPEMQTSDGFEYQLGVNHLGHFLLTTMLLPALLEPAKPVRIINVASTAHLFGKIDLDDLMSRKNYQPWTAYGQSKLANIMFTYEMARRLPTSSAITVNTLHPGVVRTELGRYLLTEPDAWFMPIVTALMTPFTLTPVEGAQTSIYLASSPEVEGLTSKYFDKCKPVSSSPASYDREVARKLWEVSLELTNAPSDLSPAAAPAGETAVVGV